MESIWIFGAMDATNYLWVGLGSGLGGMARHWVATSASGKLIGLFPWGTWIVNVSGCFLIGLAVALALRGGFFASATAQSFFPTGFLGGFTTFSAFGFQTWQLFQQGQNLLGLLNVLGSVLACLLAVWLGVRAGHPPIE